MSQRFTHEHVETWRREGGVLIQDFFTPEEVAAVGADFETVFGPPAAAQEALVSKGRYGIGDFHKAQFKGLVSPPQDCSPALNLIGVHPAAMAFARAALETEELHLYQCQAWAKYTGAADYEQPFHCDFVNHTLVAPSEDPRRNSVTIICYFSDVTEAHGPMHYVPKSDSDPIAGPEATFILGEAEAELHHRLAPFARSTAAPAGSVFAYGIDLYHRGTNLTAPGGYRYAVMTCFKRRDDATIGYTAWPFHHTQPWRNVIEHGTPEQLACFGVAPPGDPFWTDVTLARAQARYPGWDLTPYRAAMPQRSAVRA